MYLWKMMAEAGFNHVRFAALGDVTYDAENQTISYDGPFVDAMTREAEKNDLSVSVRLQGFSVNLRGFKDAELIDERGKTPNFAWSDFVRSTLNHPGILEDLLVCRQILGGDPVADFHIGQGQRHFPALIGYI